MKILLVELKSEASQQLAKALANKGHEVMGLGQGQDAIPFLNGYWPDALLLDFFLSEGTALDLCSEIQSLFGELPPVIIHSPANEHRFLAPRFTQYNFLTSPLSSEELDEALERVELSKVSLTG